MYLPQVTMMYSRNVMIYVILFLEADVLLILHSGVFPVYFPCALATQSVLYLYQSTLAYHDAFSSYSYLVIHI